MTADDIRSRRIGPGGEMVAATLALLAQCSDCQGVKVGPQRTVRLSRFRGRRLSIRTECRIARFGPMYMRKPLSRPARDDGGTSRTSIRRHPPWWSAMREYAVAPIQYRGVAMRHVGPRDATWVTLPISTWTASPRRALAPRTRVPVKI